MTSRQFAYKMNRASKNILKPLIPALGLHKKAETVLYKRYVEEVCLYDIAEDLGISYKQTSSTYLLYKTVSAFLCKPNAGIKGFNIFFEALFIL